MTCPGGTASLDMILNLIERRHGRDLAGEIADEFIQHRVRDGNDPQRMTLESRTRIGDPRLLSAISAMEKNLEEPLSLRQLCAVSGLSLRHLQRRFTEVLGRSPSAFYRELRLQRARRMLMHGSRSILEVAVATGFVSGSHFSRCYRAQFGRPPREEQAP
jgi:transcriptional regulator GlxA family with amidase domain